MTGIVLTTLVIAINILVSHYINTGNWNIGNKTKVYIAVSDKKFGISWWVKSLFHASYIFPFSLNSLMEEDIGRAQHFLDELTTVFRYLLRNNNTVLTTLEQELQFLRSYYRLLQIRFGTAIDTNVRIHDQHLHFLLPPLTLQLLVENAVKHNQYSRQSPLKIELFSDKENKLVVSNNINLKIAAVESTGIGLQSIRTRYHMLNKPEPVVQQVDGSMHLIDPATADSSGLS